MTNPCCCHNKVLLSRFNITGLGVMLFGHTRIHTHTRTHPPCSFYTCFLVSFPFHLIRLPSLLFNASAWVVYSISAPCCSLRHCLPLCPPYFSHNFIFYPPPPLSRCSFSSFSCTSRRFPALFGLGLSSLFCLLVFPLLASILLSYLLLLPFRVSLSTPRPSLFFGLILTSPPPRFPSSKFSSPLLLLRASPPSPAPPPSSARLTLAEL